MPDAGRDATAFAWRSAIICLCSSSSPDLILPYALYERKLELVERIEERLWLLPPVNDGSVDCDLMRALDLANRSFEF